MRASCCRGRHFRTCRCTHASTIQSLAGAQGDGAGAHGEAAAEAPDLAAEVELDADICIPGGSFSSAHVTQSRQIRTVFLTGAHTVVAFDSLLNVIWCAGATGFIGAFLLARLLATTACDVVCLVRCRDEQHGEERIIKNLARFKLEVPERVLRARVQAVRGFLGPPFFGMGADQFQYLARSVDLIIHNGALVRAPSDVCHWCRRLT